MEFNCYIGNCKISATKFNEKNLNTKFCDKHFDEEIKNGDHCLYLDRIQLNDSLTKNFIELDEKRSETLKRINKYCLIAIEKIRQKTKVIIEKVKNSFEIIKRKIKDLKFSEVKECIEKIEFSFNDEEWLDRIETIFEQNFMSKPEIFPINKNENQLLNLQTFDMIYIGQSTPENSSRLNHSRISSQYTYSVENLPYLEIKYNQRSSLSFENLPCLEIKRNQRSSLSFENLPFLEIKNKQRLRNRKSSSKPQLFSEIMPNNKKEGKKCNLDELKEGTELRSTSILPSKNHKSNFKEEKKSKHYRNNSKMEFIDKKEFLNGNDSKRIPKSGYDEEMNNLNMATPKVEFELPPLDIFRTPKACQWIGGGLANINSQGGKTNRNSSRCKNFNIKD